MPGWNFACCVKPQFDDKSLLKFRTSGLSARIYATVRYWPHSYFSKYPAAREVGRWQHGTGRFSLHLSSNAEYEAGKGASTVFQAFCVIRQRIEPCLLAREGAWSVLIYKNPVPLRLVVWHHHDVLVALSQRFLFFVYRKYTKIGS